MPSNSKLLGNDRRHFFEALRQNELSFVVHSGRTVEW